MSTIHTLSRPYRRYRLGDVTSTSATANPAWYSLLAWWRASDLALADGASVSTWNSIVGSSVASAGSAPTYKTTAGPGGVPSVLWSGGSTYLNITPSLSLNLSTWTVGAVVISNGDGQLLGSSGVNYQMRKFRSGANNISVYNNSVDVQSNTFTTVYNNAVVCWWVYSGAGISFYENQTARGGPTGWSTYSSPIDQMGRTSYGGNWSGYTSEICVWDVTLPPAAISTLYLNYFVPRYNNVFVE